MNIAPERGTTLHHHNPMWHTSSGVSSNTSPTCVRHLLCASMHAFSRLQTTEVSMSLRACLSHHAYPCVHTQEQCSDEAVALSPLWRHLLGRGGSATAAPGRHSPPPSINDMALSHSSSGLHPAELLVLSWLHRRHLSGSGVPGRAAKSWVHVAWNSRILGRQPASRCSSRSTGPLNSPRRVDTSWRKSPSHGSGRSPESLCITCTSPLQLHWRVLH